ncbi:hypothetical protein [Thermomonas carbonis]|uniref:DUF2306 domain-containing protein n=1 Tax=Thermomonas carbonis TaxID=1463158 RepID=A0A7G9SRC7_9GAMM|nr:hypothetical protein [Thermomonas carbonis]QNN70402.1 hypothetical protein H9L16_01825 [Thermomonas carbonis]GHB99757.1 hypothetical protein GCM10010080_10880 [Thermomonas carbonis]
MKRPYANIGFFFLLLLALVIAGFTPRIPETPFFGYFGHVAKGVPVPGVIHAHAIVALAWFVLLCVQPFLIRANRVDLHRWLGRASVILVVLVAYTAVQVMKRFYLQGITQMPRDTVLSLLSQSFTGLSLFLLFYAMAIWRRRNLHQHVAFMVGASLAAATPGLARLGLHVIGGLPGILAVVAGIYGTLVAGMLFAKFRYSRPVSRSPYLAIIGLFLAAHAMDFVGSRSSAWRWFADKMVSVW